MTTETDKVADITVVAKAKFFIEGDDTGSEYLASIVEYQGIRWLVANWIESPATGKRTPDELIPMGLLPHAALQDGLVQLGTLIPRELLTAQIPQKLRLVYGVVRYPGVVHIPGPGGIH